MKKTKILVLITLLASIFSLTGCFKKSYEQTASKDKTQLYVAVQDGGYGSYWLKAAAARFEEKYKDVSFEEGKVGVQVMVDCSTNYKGSKIENLLSDPSFEYEVIFTEGVNYYDLINQGYILDITDVLTSSLQYDFITKETDETQEDATILSKIISSELSNYLEKDSKYYAVPYFDAYYGIIYDVDLFVEENLYFAAPGEGDSKGFVKDESTKKGTGPDGVYGTYDDGLPRTYEEFFILCDAMVKRGITPLTWTGKYNEYMSYFAQSLCVDYEGKESMKVDLEFNGTIDTYVDGFDENGSPILTTKTIPVSESYELNNKRAGKYYAMSFLEQLIHNKTYYDENNCFGVSVSNLQAQKNFLYGKYITTSNRVAMLIDGTWWQNEASDAFDTLVKTFGDGASAQSRNFGIMPLPKATEEQVGEKYTISNGGSSYGFINANIKSDKVNLAKAFMQFLHTNESLCEFNTLTSATRPFTYTFTTEEYNALSYYGQTSYNIHNSSDFYAPYSKNTNFIQNSAKVGYMWCVRINSNDYGLPSYCLYNNQNYTARQMFEGLSNFYTPTWWNTNLNITIDD